MTRIKTIAAIMLSLLLLAGCQRNQGYVQLGGYAQGGTWTVKYNPEGVSLKPDQVKAGIDSILTLIDTTLSGYNKGSLLSRLNAGDTITPNRLLIDTYNEGYRYWQQTDGALDFAAGPLFDIWGFGFKTDSLPSDDKVRAALRTSGLDRLVPSMQSAMQDGKLWGPWLEKPLSKNEAREDVIIYPQLNYNATAQGLSCDMVASYLYKIGVAKDLLVDIGEIFCDGVNPGGDPWNIGIDRPKDGNNSPGADLDGIWQSNGESVGVVTSGNYRKFYVHEGQKYSHTIDPRSGYPVQHNLLSATIISESAESADAYATYCMVIGLEDAKEFIQTTQGVEGYLIFCKEDGSMSEWASEGFKLKEK